jgi:uncharacterized protein YkwD
MPFAVPPPPEAVIAQNRAENAIVREVNRVRRAHGLRRVRLSGGLARVARRHSVAMLRHDQLSHSSFDGSSFTARLSRAGRRGKYGETLAWSPSGSGAGPRLVVRLWMQSATHRHVLLNRRLRRVGVARVHGRLGAQRGHAITADFSS